MVWRVGRCAKGVLWSAKKENFDRKRDGNSSPHVNVMTRECVHGRVELHANEDECVADLALARLVQAP